MSTTSSRHVANTIIDSVFILLDVAITLGLAWRWFPALLNDYKLEMSVAVLIKITFGFYFSADFYHRCIMTCVAYSVRMGEHMGRPQTSVPGLINSMANISPSTEQFNGPDEIPVFPEAKLDVDHANPTPISVPRLDRSAPSQDPSSAPSDIHSSPPEEPGCLRHSHHRSVASQTVHHESLVAFSTAPSAMLAAEAALQTQELKQERDMYRSRAYELAFKVDEFHNRQSETLCALERSQAAIVELRQERDVLGVALASAVTTMPRSLAKNPPTQPFQVAALNHRSSVTNESLDDPAKDPQSGQTQSSRRLSMEATGASTISTAVPHVAYGVAGSSSAYRSPIVNAQVKMSPLPAVVTGLESELVMGAPPCKEDVVLYPRAAVGHALLPRMESSNRHGLTLPAAVKRSEKAGEMLSPPTTPTSSRTRSLGKVVSSWLRLPVGTRTNATATADDGLQSSPSTKTIRDALDLNSLKSASAQPIYPALKDDDHRTHDKPKEVVSKDCSEISSTHLADWTAQERVTNRRHSARPSIATVIPPCTAQAQYNQGREIVTTEEPGGVQASPVRPSRERIRTRTGAQMDFQGAVDANAEERKNLDRRSCEDGEQWNTVERKVRKSSSSGGIRARMPSVSVPLGRSRQATSPPVTTSGTPAAWRERRASVSAGTGEGVHASRGRASRPRNASLGFAAGAGERGKQNAPYFEHQSHGMRRDIPQSHVEPQAFEDRDPGMPRLRRTRSNISLEERATKSNMGPSPWVLRAKERAAAKEREREGGLRGQGTSGIYS